MYKFVKIFAKFTWSLVNYSTNLDETWHTDGLSISEIQYGGGFCVYPLNYIIGDIKLPVLILVCSTGTPSHWKKFNDTTDNR